MNNYNESGLHYCNICDYQCTRKDNLNKHIQYEHEGKPRTKCSLCDKTFTINYELKEHKRIVHDRIKVKCNQCEKGFGYRNALKKHIKIFHELKRLICDICYHRSRSDKTFEAHKRTHIGEQLQCNDKKIKKTAAVGVTKESKNQYRPEYMKFPEITKCDQCDKMYIWKSDMSVHIKAVHEGVRYKCDQCDYQGKYKSQMRAHKNKHDGKFMKCDKCTYQSTSSSDMKMHKQRRHLQEKNFKCDVCTYKSATRTEIKIHTQRMHSKEKNFKCDVCGQAYSSRQSFKKHQSSHKLRFTCFMCDHEDVSDVCLQNHMKDQHLIDMNHIQENIQTN